MISGTNSSIYRFERVSKLSFYPSARNNPSKNYTRIKRKKVSLPCFVHETWKREERLKTRDGGDDALSPRPSPLLPTAKPSVSSSSSTIFRVGRSFARSPFPSVSTFSPLLARFAPPPRTSSSVLALSPLSLSLSTLYFLEGGPPRFLTWKSCSISP